MLDREQEGTLRLKASETQSDAFEVTFTLSFGGDPRAAKTLASREALETFLSDLGVPPETQRRAIGEAHSRGSGSIPRFQVTQTEVEENWPLSLLSNPSGRAKTRIGNQVQRFPTGRTNT